MEETMRYIGVDLHKDNFVVCYMGKGTEEKRFEKYKLLEIGKFIKTLNKEDILAVESTTNVKYFRKKVKDYVSRVIVVNPRKFKIISESTKKTDKNDAELLAYYASKEMLPEVRIKDDAYVEIESLTNTRNKLVELRSSLKNKIHNLLLSQGILTKKEQFSSDKSLEKVLEYEELSETVRFELKIIVNQILSLNESIKEIDKKLEELGKSLSGFTNITSIKGIGTKTGITLLAVIGNINDFENEKKLFSYFGLVPTIHHSNNKKINGHITKRGSKLGRKVLIQSTLIAIKYSPYLRDFYTRLRMKKGNGKAIIATSRKLLKIIYLTLKYNLVFEDFSNFVIKAA